MANETKPIIPRAIFTGVPLFPPIKQVRMVVNTHPHTVKVTNQTDDINEKLYSVKIYTFRSQAQFDEWRHSPAFDPDGFYKLNKEQLVLAYCADAQIVGETGTHINNIFPGRRLFQLKATHGVPLEISLENLTRRSMVVDWEGFIEEARLSGWYDFQTLEVIQNALADVFDRDYQEAITLRLKRYILRNPMAA